MSKQAKDLVNAFKMLSATEGMVTAKVVSVDKTNNTCEVSMDSNELGAVRLQAVVDVNRKGCRLYPAANSSVIIEQMDDKGNWVVALYSEIEEVMFETDTMSFKMNAAGIVFNGGSLGGLLKLAQTVTQLNKIEDDVNALKTAFKNWVTMPNDGGAALKTIASSWANQSLTKTTINDVKNDHIKQ